MDQDEHDIEGGGITMGRPIMHFEIGSSNLDLAAEFYRELFDWSVGEELMDGYRLVQTAEGSIGGGLLRTPDGVLPYVTVYVGVEDLQETLRKAEELGGKMVVEPMPIPGVGAFAMLQSPDGVVIGLFREQPAQGA
jgi:predicted enzyme related to lactoylglutathione lyase